MPPSSLHSLWGWTQAARIVLSVIAGAAAVGLLLVGREPQGPIGQPPPKMVVDLNTAPPQVLAALPRLGPVLVARIVAARRDAPFRSIEDFDERVKGIGPATIKALRPFVTVRPAETDAGPRLAKTAIP